MLRYYTYYSVSGYKAFYLGSDKDSDEERYFLPQIPTVEETEAIVQLSETNDCGFPPKANSLLYRAGYKLLYRYISEDTYALSLRDISYGNNDEDSRPFMIVIVGDTADDVLKLDIIATYLASYLHAAEQQICSFLGYDKEKDCLRFKLAKFNLWLDWIVNEKRSVKIATGSGVIKVRGIRWTVALLVLPKGISSASAKDEQDISTLSTFSVAVDDIISKEDSEYLVNRLEHTESELGKARKSLAKKNKTVSALGILCSALGLMLVGVLLLRLFGWL